MEIKPKLIKVRHAEGTTTSEDSWLDYWKEHSSYSVPKICPCCKHESSDIVGAHIIDEQGNLYICPKCRSCNSTYKNSKLYYWFEVEKRILVDLPK